MQRSASSSVPLSDDSDLPRLSQAPALIVLALVAIGVPSSLAYNFSPSATFLNQAFAMLGWGLFLALAVQQSRPGSLQPAWERLLPTWLAFTLLGGTALAATFLLHQPSSLSLSSVGFVYCAAVAFGVAALLPSLTADARQAYNAFHVALLIAGVISLGIAFVQCFAPQWADGSWIARPATPGRAGGNLRQPNHLSTLLLWSLVALVHLHDSHVERRGASTLGRGLTLLLLVGFILGVVLTVSRTGMVCVGLLMVWGAADRRLARYSRVLLILTPLVYAICWALVSVWASSGEHAFAGDEQLHKGDLSSSRFGIWANTLSLIAQHPWFGVGWGEFNLAWSLTPFPGRPVAFFDHTHNLPLQLLVELGVPLALLVLGLLLVALWFALRACLVAPEGSQPPIRAAFVIVVMAGVHSMLEYPLWYAYFLLPAAFALGICLGTPAGAPADAASAMQRASLNQRVRHGLLALSVLMALGAGYSMVDYRRVVQIFSPSDDAPSLPERILDGQGSLFFSHHAAYAAATTAQHPGQVMGSLKSASHYLLDTRLMMAWARGYAEQGDLDRARHIAQRLREFHNAQSEEFFAVCDEPPAEGQALPFQCTPPGRELRYEDFR